jgi:hypothetical protein
LPEPAALSLCFDEARLLRRLVSTAPGSARRLVSTLALTGFALSTSPVPGDLSAFQVPPGSNISRTGVARAWQGAGVVTRGPYLPRFSRPSSSSASPDVPRAGPVVPLPEAASRVAAFGPLEGHWSNVAAAVRRYRRNGHLRIFPIYSSCCHRRYSSQAAEITSA